MCKGVRSNKWIVARVGNWLSWQVGVVIKTLQKLENGRWLPRWFVIVTLAWKAWKAIACPNMREQPSSRGLLMCSCAIASFHFEPCD